jgi:hypothetical protein
MNSTASGALLWLWLSVLVLLLPQSEGARAGAGAGARSAVGDKLRSLLPLKNIQNIKQQINLNTDENDSNENENENENQFETQQTEITKSSFHLPDDHADIMLPSKRTLTAKQINEWIDSDVFTLTKQDQIMYHWIKTIGGKISNKNNFQIQIQIEI